MKAEKAQKGNPHNITLNQHIFPIKSIERFLNSKGFVEVYLKSVSEIKQMKPKNKLFCGNRNWDQKAENGFMKDIEDSFQSIASGIVARKIAKLNDRENKIVTAFFALWRQRHLHMTSPIEDTELIGIHPGKELRKNEEKILEKKGYILTKNKNSKATIPSRFMNSINILSQVDKERYKYQKLKWGIVKSTDGEFVVPDTFSNYTFVPLSPNLILVGNSDDLFISRNEVVKVNETAISASYKYYFGRNLANCPV